MERASALYGRLLEALALAACALLFFMMLVICADVLLRNVGANLTSDGWLVLEIGHERGHFESRFGGPEGLEPLWLDNSSGCDAVLALAADPLRAWATQAAKRMVGVVPQASASRPAPR